MNTNPDTRFLPVTPERWRDFESLFGECGAYEHLGLPPKGPLPSAQGGLWDGG